LRRRRGGGSDADHQPQRIHAPRHQAGGQGLEGIRAANAASLVEPTTLSCASPHPSLGTCSTRVIGRNCSRAPSRRDTQSSRPLSHGNAESEVAAAFRPSRRVARSCPSVIGNDAASAESVLIPCLPPRSGARAMWGDGGRGAVAHQRAPRWRASCSMPRSLRPRPLTHVCRPRVWPRPWLSGRRSNTLTDHGSTASHSTSTLSNDFTGSETLRRSGARTTSVSSAPRC
jgi:hypothetical protein